MAEVKRVHVRCQSIMVERTDDDEDNQCDLYGVLNAHRIVFTAFGEEFKDTKRIWSRDSDEYRGIGTGEGNRYYPDEGGSEILILEGEWLGLGGNLNDYDPFNDDHLGNQLKRIAYNDIKNETHTLFFDGSGGRVHVVYTTGLL